MVFLELGSPSLQCSGFWGSHITLLPINACLPEFNIPFPLFYLRGSLTNHHWGIVWRRPVKLIVIMWTSVFPEIGSWNIFFTSRMANYGRNIGKNILRDLKCFLCDTFIPSLTERVRIFWQSIVDLACLIERMVSEDFSASQTAGANAMRRDIRDFYELKRQRVRRQRTERDDKPMNEMKILHLTCHNNQVYFGGEICHTQFAAISFNVSAIFASRNEGGFCNVRLHALFARHSLLKQRGLLVLVYNM